MTSLPSYEEARQTLSAEEYRTYLRVLDLEAITLESLQTELNRSALVGSGDLLLRTVRDLRLAESDEESAALAADYTIEALNREQAVLTIRVTYFLHLSFPEQAPPAFFAIYAHRSADMQVWPFLRELAHSLTSRMELPPLTLPLLLDPTTLTPPPDAASVQP